MGSSISFWRHMPKCFRTYSIIAVDLLVHDSLIFPSLFGITNRRETETVGFTFFQLHLQCFWYRGRVVLPSKMGIILEDALD